MPRRSNNYDGPSIVDWLDPTDPAKVQAWRSFQKTGNWPQDLWDAELWQYRVVRNWEHLLATKIALYFANGGAPPDSTASVALASGPDDYKRGLAMAEKIVLSRRDRFVKTEDKPKHRLCNEILARIRKEMKGKL